MRADELHAEPGLSALIREDSPRREENPMSPPQAKPTRGLKPRTLHYEGGGCRATLRLDPRPKRTHALRQ